MAVLRTAERKLKNFVFADVTNTFTGSTTSFTVDTGQGSRFPDTVYALVLYNASTYDNPSEAYQQGEAEVVLCTSRTGDTLTLVRALEGSAGISSQMGKRYRLVLDVTSGLAENIPRYLNVRAYGAKGDGTTNDTQAFLDAIADLPSWGGCIFVPASSGAYILTQNVTATDRFKITKSKVMILGEGPGRSIIKGASGAGVDAVLIKIHGTTSAKITDITIRDLELDGNAAGASITSGTQAHLIDLMNCERVWIENCYMHDSPGDCVRTNYEDAAVRVTDVWVRNNRMQTCYRNFVSIVAAERIYVESNVMKGFNTVGVDVEPNNSGDVTRDVVIANNYIEPAPTHLNTNNSNRLAGIQCKCPTAAHDSNSHVRISGNQIVGLDDSGTQYPAFGITIVKYRDVTIIGNQVKTCRQGIDCGASDGTDDGSTGTCVGNTVWGSVGSTSGPGIKARTRWTISGNVSEENDGPGIQVSGRSCTITGNLCQNNGKNGSDSSTSRKVGIWIEGEDCTVIGNCCRDTQGTKTQQYGLYLEDGAADNIISENNFLDNLTLGIFVQPTGLNGNRVRFNLGYVTENGGQSEIASGSTTSGNIAHGLSRVPSALDFTITQRDVGANDPGDFYVEASTIDATNFVVKCRNNPGSGGFKFAWAVRPRH